MTTEQILKLSSRKNVKKIAVENFLSSLGGMRKIDAIVNCDYDAFLYGWNKETKKAIMDGIEKHYMQQV